MARVCRRPETDPRLPPPPPAACRLRSFHLQAVDTMEIQQSPVMAAKWSIVLGQGLGLGSAPGLEVLCRDPSARSPPAATAPGNYSTAADDGKCLHFVRTGGCDPTGIVMYEENKGCAATILPGWSGYCRCGVEPRTVVKHRVACGHNPFTCAEVCRVTFPAVLAASNERPWTNQVGV